MSLQSLLGKYQNKNSGNSNKRPRNDTKLSEKSQTANSTTQIIKNNQKSYYKNGEFVDGCVTSNGDMAVMGKKSKTDKVSHHGYYRFYPRYLEHLRPLDVSSGHGMLEIGIDQSHSLQMWLDYFPESFIYGLDIGVEDQGERYRIFQADQSDNQQLKPIVDKKIKHEIFFIIDDGSHIPEHQVSCFDYLFDVLLKPGGTYIIEDIETSYWTKNGLYGYNTSYGYQHELSCIEIFKQIADDVNREFLTTSNREKHDKKMSKYISTKTRNLISSITFGTNCILVVKKTEEEHNLFSPDRDYRFRKNL